MTGLIPIAVVSIPTSIRWQVRMKTDQKLGIGAVLCLGFAIVACIQFSGIHARGSSILTWEYFWLEIEACVAVCMVSLTAFRSVFASDAANFNRGKARPWYYSTIVRLRRRKKPDDHDLEKLLAIPSATLSGMRTFIRGSELDLGKNKFSDREPLRSSGAICVVLWKPGDRTIL